jgi:hypothetical protein
LPALAGETPTRGFAAPGWRAPTSQQIEACLETSLRFKMTTNSAPADGLDQILLIRDEAAG